MQILCLMDIWRETFCPTGLEVEEDDKSGTVCWSGPKRLLDNTAKLYVMNSKTVAKSVYEDKWYDAVK